MAKITLHGDLISTIGSLPKVGTSAPNFEVVKTDLSVLSNQELKGKNVILNIFPSIDTGICAASTKRFNKESSDLENTVVLCISMDLPFALNRFCGAEGISAVVPGSAFRSTLGKDYQVTIADGPLVGLLSRAIIVINPEGIIIHTEQVPEIAQEPDYEAALAALT